MRGSINRNSVDNLGNHGGYQLHGDNSNHNRADLLVLLNPELSGSTVYTQINTAPVTETAFVDTGVLERAAPRLALLLHTDGKSARQYRPYRARIFRT